MKDTNIQFQLSNEILASDRESLVTAIALIGEVRQTERRFLGADWVAFVLLMKQIGTAAGGLAAVVKLANELKTWRDRMKKEKKEPALIVEPKSEEPLDLRNATDEEIDEWFKKRGL